MKGQQVLKMTAQSSPGLDVRSGATELKDPYTIILIYMILG